MVFWLALEAEGAGASVQMSELATPLARPWLNHHIAAWVPLLWLGQWLLWCKENSAMYLASGFVTMSWTCQHEA